MKVELSHRPAFAFAKLHLSEGESAYVRPGAMATIQGSVRPQATLGGNGLGRALFRRAADQTSIMAKYTAKGYGIVGVAPPLPGDIQVLDLAVTGPIRIDAGAVLAYEDTVTVSTRLTGLRRTLLREGLIGLKAEGNGQIVLSSFGAIEQYVLQAGENLIVDGGHMVAWSASMKMDFGPLGGLPRSGLIGEGFVGAFQGPGVVLVQTRMNPEKLTRKR